MSDFGFASWTPAGVKNNYGLVPISVLGFFSVTNGQQSGGASYTLPSGFVMEILQVSSDAAYTTIRRKINISGGSVSISSVSGTDFSANTYPAVAGFIIAYLRAA